MLFDPKVLYPWDGTTKKRRVMKKAAIPCPFTAVRMGKHVRKLRRLRCRRH